MPRNPVLMQHTSNSGKNNDLFFKNRVNKQNGANHMTHVWKSPKAKQVLNSVTSDKLNLAESTQLYPNGFQLASPTQYKKNIGHGRDKSVTFRDFNSELENQQGNKKQRQPSSPQNLPNVNQKNQKLDQKGYEAKRGQAFCQEPYIQKIKTNNEDFISSNLKVNSILSPQIFTKNLKVRLTAKHNDDRFNMTRSNLDGNMIDQNLISPVSRQTSRFKYGPKTPDRNSAYSKSTLPINSANNSPKTPNSNQNRSQSHWLKKQDNNKNSQKSQQDQLQQTMRIQQALNEFLDGGAQGQKKGGAEAAQFEYHPEITCFYDQKQIKQLMTKDPANIYLKM